MLVWKIKVGIWEGFPPPHPWLFFFLMVNRAEDLSEEKSMDDPFCGLNRGFYKRIM